MNHRFPIAGAAALAAMLFSFATAALDLQAARDAGLVAEKKNGYVTAVGGSAEAKALADEVNSRRREEYQKISKGNGQPADVVAKLAAEQIIQKLKPGNLYEGDGGGWKKR